MTQENMSFIEKENKMKKEVNWEACRQLWKLGFSVCIVIVLVLINNNVNSLLNCLLFGVKSISRESLSSKIIDNKIGETCFMRQIGSNGISLCRLKDQNYLLRVDGDKTVSEFEGLRLESIVCWVRKCESPERVNICGIEKGGNDKKCSYISWFKKDPQSYFCFDVNYNVTFLNLNGSIFRENDAIHFMNFLVKSDFNFNCMF